MPENSFGSRKVSLLTGLFASVFLSVAPVSAQQSFTQMIVFGDSTVDSGFYKGLSAPGGGANYDALWAKAVAAGAGVPTTSPGPMSVQILAARFGLTANPANQPGGTNYATSGAKNIAVNDGTNGGFRAAIPTATQIANYIHANDGRVDPGALYLISSGGNDVAFAFSSAGPSGQSAKITYLTNAANGLVAAIDGLSRAGAQTIIVPGLQYSFPLSDSAQQQAKLAYTQALWSGLNANGVNFIPADFNSVRLKIQANPSAFGFRFIGTAPGQMACLPPTNSIITSAWALLCSANSGAPSQLASPDAPRTYLFADDQHMTTAGEQLEADYFFSLIPTCVAGGPACQAGN
jgi:outer membrane lipase/esterase